MELPWRKPDSRSGEGEITQTAAMISAEIGKGKVALVGFRTQHRAQTYGMFKVLFHSLEN